jgi:hypothetical protein
MPTVRLLPPGSVSNFSRDGVGHSYGLNWENGHSIPLVLRPVELIAGSAIGFSCSLTLVDEVLDSFIIPAGLLGVNSILQIEPVWSFTSSANTKTLNVKIGANNIYSVARTASVTEAPLILLANRNSVNSQVSPYSGNYVTAGSVAPATYTIDFSKDQVVAITGRRTNAGDSLILEYYRVLHFVGF